MKPLVRVRKKGKTRGRPSKWENSISKLLSWQMEKAKPEILKAHWDMVLYGKGCIEVKANGKIKHKSMKSNSGKVKERL